MMILLRHALRVITLVWVAVTVPGLAATPRLAAPEKSLVRHVDKSFADQVGFLEKIVNQNSETMNFEGVQQVGEWLVDELRALGFDARWDDMRQTANRAGHVIATRKGTIGKRILLIGHIDTVHPVSSPFSRLVRSGDRATGPGTEDMKNGVAVMLYALKALNRQGLLANRSISIVLTGDEESPADDIALTRKSMIDAARQSDVVLSFEPGEPAVIVTSRRGATSWQLDVRGKQAHSGSIFSEATGAGAIFETARILNDFYENLRSEPKLTFNAGGMAGGTQTSFDSKASAGTFSGKVNIVPPSSIVFGEMRTTSAAQEARTRAAMEAVVARHLPNTSASISFRMVYPAMDEKPGNMILQGDISAISTALGAGPLLPNDPLTRGAGDISFVANDVPMALDGLGGAGGGGHSPDEWVDLNSMRISTQRAAILMARLGSDK